MTAHNPKGSRKKMRDRTAAKTPKPLMKWDDIYELPLYQWKDFCRVDDNRCNFVFEFITRFNDKGDYQEGWLNYEKEILAAINGEKTFNEDNLVYSHENGLISVSNISEPIIRIRGWGNLTGIGCHNLSCKDAANIQDTFADFIISRLNAR